MYRNIFSFIHDSDESGSVIKYLSDDCNMLERLWCEMACLEFMLIVLIEWYLSAWDCWKTIGNAINKDCEKEWRWKKNLREFNQRNKKKIIEDGEE